MIWYFVAQQTAMFTERRVSVIVLCNTAHWYLQCVHGYNTTRFIWIDMFFTQLYLWKNGCSWKHLLGIGCFVMLGVWQLNIGCRAYSGWPTPMYTLVATACCRLWAGGGLLRHGFTASVAIFRAGMIAVLF